MLEDYWVTFKNTVNVLVVDDEPGVLETTQALFDMFGVYNVTVAASTRQALEEIARNKSRFHACALDLGIADVERNEYYLLDKYAKVIPFIITSGRQDTEKGFECSRRGARAFARKGSQSFYQDLILNVNKNALINILCPQYNESRQDLLCKSLEMLVATNPQSVSEWAHAMNVMERQLHREWKERLGVNPLLALCICHLYSGLFTTIQNNMSDMEPIATFTLDGAVKSLLESGDYRKTFEYYLLHKQQITLLIMSPVHCG